VDQGRQVGSKDDHLCCHYRFLSNEMRLGFRVLAYNLGNLLAALTLPMWN